MVYFIRLKGKERIPLLLLEPKLSLSHLSSTQQLLLLHSDNFVALIFIMLVLSVVKRSSKVWHAASNLDLMICQSSRSRKADTQ